MCSVTHVLICNNIIFSSSTLATIGEADKYTYQGIVSVTSPKGRVSFDDIRPPAVLTTAVTVGSVSAKV